MFSLGIPQPFKTSKKKESWLTFKREGSEEYLSSAKKMCKEERQSPSKRGLEAMDLATFSPSLPPDTSHEALFCLSRMRWVSKRISAATAGPKTSSFQTSICLSANIFCPLGFKIQTLKVKGVGVKELYLPYQKIPSFFFSFGGLKNPLPLFYFKGLAFIFFS